MNEKTEAKQLNIEIGDRLRELRIKANLSQAKFITKMQCMGYYLTVSTYSRYECGDSAIPISYIRVFCDYYHVTADYLITGEQTLEDQKISKMLHLLTKENKQLIQKFLSNFAHCLESYE